MREGAFPMDPGFNGYVKRYGSVGIKLASELSFVLDKIKWKFGQVFLYFVTMVAGIFLNPPNPQFEVDTSKFPNLWMVCTLNSPHTPPNFISTP